MPLKIAGINIDELSGPISLGYCEPTEKFEKEIGIKLPALLLLGDKHDSVELQCDINENAYEQSIKNSNDKLTVGLMSPGWYRLLDTISSSESPIDYYIETFYPVKELQNADHLNKKWGEPLLIESNKHVMLYLIDKYLSCFTKEEVTLKSDNCCTQKIRYHMVDIRYNMSYFKIKQAKDSYKIPFESILMNNLISCLFDFSNFNEKQVDNLSHISIDPNFLYSNILFSFETSQHKQQSLIYKQILKQQNVLNNNRDTHSINYWSNFCLQYCSFYVKEHALTMEQMITKLQNALAHYKFLLDNKHLHDLITFTTAAKDFRSMYQASVSLMIRFLFYPVLDIYYLLRSWKRLDNTKSQSKQGWLSVLNAGFTHTHSIQTILPKMGLYVAHISTDISHVYHKEYRRCLQFPTNFTYDLSTYNRHFIPNEIAKQRIQLLKPKLYFDILNMKTKLSYTEVMKLVGNDKKKLELFEKMEQTK